MVRARGLLAGGGHRARRRQHEIHRILRFRTLVPVWPGANPNLPWPQFDVSSYAASINYDGPSSHVQIVRKQTIEAGRQRPVPVEQKPDLYFSGAQAWNLAPPPNSPPGTAPIPTSQPAAVEERAAEIWATPQGFLKAALANNAKSEPAGENVEVSFTVGGKYHYAGTINARN